MKSRIKNVLFFLLVLGVVASEPAQAVLIPVSEDTSSTIESKINETTGKAATLPVTSKQTAFLLFDLSSFAASTSASNIVSARLNLYISSLAKPGDLTVRMVTNQWQENTASVAAPGYSSEAVGVIPAADLATKSFLVVDVTAAVSNWFSGASNYGIAITTSSASVRLASKEGLGSGFPALLEIETAANSAAINLSQLTNGVLPLSSLPAAVVTNNETGVNLGGNFSGSGASLTNAAGNGFADTNMVQAASNTLASQIASLSAVVTDTRPLRNSDIKNQSVAAFASTTIYTNSGPATIQSIRVAWYANGAALATTPPTFSFWQDGVTNNCQLFSFFAAGGFPYIFHGDAIDVAMSQVEPGSGVAFAGQRLVQIHCQTSGGIAVTFPYAAQLFSDVFYRVGPTPVTNTWHVAESQETVPANGSFTPFNYSGSPGRIESVYMFGLANGGQGYLEAKPVLTFDGVPVIMGNGTEDSFGGSFYWNYGADHYATPQWGTQAETNLQYLYGFTDGNASYRFMNGAYFTNSASLSCPNVTASAISNDWVVTYYTVP